jgi:DNA-binding response OmpR family regulator
MNNKKILVLDDDKVFLEEFLSALVSNGYEPFTVDDTDGFMGVVVKIEPAVIVLDLKMPKKTGLLVALELKESGKTAHIPIIAMSGFVKENYALPLGLTNIKVCLKKPFSPADLIATIEKVLRKDVA